MKNVYAGLEVISRLEKQALLTSTILFHSEKGQLFCPYRKYWLAPGKSHLHKPKQIKFVYTKAPLFWQRGKKNGKLISWFIAIPWDIPQSILFSPHSFFSSLFAGKISFLFIHITILWSYLELGINQDHTESRQGWECFKDHIFWSFLKLLEIAELAKWLFRKKSPCCLQKLLLL